MHTNSLKDETGDIPDDLLKEFDVFLEDYINCTMDYPVYYKDSLLKEELEDLERDKLAQKAEEERKRKDREDHTRKYGTCTLIFL